jgi:hypothetical protein
MQTALFGFRFFPPPSPGALVFPSLDRAGARGAADTWKAPIVQFVVRHFMGGDIIPHLPMHPIRQGIDLDDIAVLAIDFDFARLRAGDRLLGADPSSNRPTRSTPA